MILVIHKPSGRYLLAEKLDAEGYWIREKGGVYTQDSIEEVKQIDSVNLLLEIRSLAESIANISDFIELRIVKDYVKKLKGGGEK